MGLTSRMTRDEYMAIAALSVTRLKEIGRTAADGWLKQNWDAIGERSSIDIRKTFL